MESVKKSPQTVPGIAQVNHLERSQFFLRHSRWMMIAFLLLVDILSIFLVLVIAIFVRTLFPGVVNLTYYFDIIPLIIIFPIIYSLQGLYPAIGIGPVDELRRLSIGTTLGFFAFILTLFLMYIPQIYSRAIFLISWVLALGLLPLARFLIRKLLINIGLWGEPVIIIGSADVVNEVLEHLRNNPIIGLRPVLRMQQEEIQIYQEDFVKSLPISISSYCKQYNIRCAILSGSHYYGQSNGDLGSLENIFERVIWINPQDNRQSLWVTLMDLGGIAGIEKKNELAKPWARAQKRFFDIAVAFLGLILLSPFFAVVALLIKLDSSGPVFYRQIRIGTNGKRFGMIKFRTMYKNADEILDDYLLENEKLKQEWQDYQKLKDDPRITRIGRFLRLYSIDELPQLWNVLKGEMSLVGPRPFMPEQKELHGETYYRYIRVRPGLTGMWQVYGRNEVSYDFRIRMDEYYYRNWSIWLDLYILIRTPWVVLRRIGAY